MNENELKTIENDDEIDNSIQLYETKTVESEEDDGPGFGLGVLIGSAIGVGATLAFTKIKNYLWTKKVQHQRATQTDIPEQQEAEQTVIEYPHGQQGSTDLDAKKEKK